jgi:hypothetical protein
LGKCTEHGRFEDVRDVVLFEPSGGDLVGGGVEQAQHGRSEPVAGEIGAEVAFLLSSRDEIPELVDDTVVLLAYLPLGQSSCDGRP